MVAVAVTRHGDNHQQPGTPWELTPGSRRSVLGPGQRHQVEQLASPQPSAFESSDGGLGHQSADRQWAVSDVTEAML